MGDDTIWNEIGTLHFNTGSYLQARRAYQRAINIGGGKTAMQNLALAYLKENEIAKAISVYKKIAKKTSDSKEKAGLWQRIGELYSLLEEHDNALQAYGFSGAEIPGNKKEIDWQTHLSPISSFGEVENASFVDLPQPSVDEEPAPVLETETLPREGSLVHINIEEIYVNPVQPRVHIDIEFLAESIRQYGIIQPLIVTPPSGENERYTLISGERRLKAARQVGLDTVPAIIRDVDERLRLRLALVENVQRRNLSLFEEAEAYEELKNELDLSEIEIAKLIGKNAVAVKNLLHLLEMPKNIQRALEAGRISEEHARSLFLLEDKRVQRKALQEVLDDELSVRKTKTLVRSMLRESMQENDIDEHDEEHQLSEEKQEASTAFVAADVVPASEVIAEMLIEEPDVIEEISDEDEDLDIEVLEDTVVNEDDLIAETESYSDEAEVIENTEKDEPITFGESLLPQTADFENPHQSYSDEEIEKRILTFKRVTEENPNNDKAWYRLGNHYVRLDDTESAIDAYSKAIDIAPHRSEYLYQLGQVYLSGQCYLEAAEMLELVVAADGKNAFARCALASSYRHLDMDDKAKVHLDIVAPMMRYEEDYNRACFEAICGNTAKSVELLNTLLEKDEITLEKIQSDSDFDFIREEPLFSELTSDVSFSEANI
ncbi:MAG: ParB/RepB/Spo0J family partition protein [Chloroflexi bacterium]|nr:ParB/RepB/Spo0J family partition protein [Chloroflexota bacterium]